MSIRSIASLVLLLLLLLLLLSVVQSTLASSRSLSSFARPISLSVRALSIYPDHPSLPEKKKKKKPTMSSTRCHESEKKKKKKKKFLRTTQSHFFVGGLGKNEDGVLSSRWMLLSMSMKTTTMDDKTEKRIFLSSSCRK